MKSVVCVIVLLGLATGTFAECGYNATDVYDICNPYFDQNLTSYQDDLGNSLNETTYCDSVFYLVNETVSCLYTAPNFTNCTAYEFADIEYELYYYYNYSCLYNDFCLLNSYAVFSNLSQCFIDFNETLTEAFDYLTGNSPDFNATCSTFQGGLWNMSDCFYEAINGSYCSDEAVYNLTLFFYEFESFYNDTCGNEDFDVEVFLYCDNPVYAFSGLASCFNYYLYDYEGYSFYEDGSEYDTSLSEEDCSEAYYYIQSTANCAEYVSDNSGCNDEVNDALLYLLKNVTDTFDSICGDDYDLDDLSIGGSTAAAINDESGADATHVSAFVLMVATLFGMLLNRLQ